MKLFVLVATWCRNCRGYKKELEEFVQRGRSDPVEVQVLAIDSLVGRQLARAHQVSRVPTTLFCQGDFVPLLLEGAVGLSELERLLKAARAMVTSARRPARGPAGPPTCRAPGHPAAVRVAAGAMSASAPRRERLTSRAPESLPTVPRTGSGCASIDRDSPRDPGKHW